MQETAEAAKTLVPIWTSLSTTGMLIAAITIIIFALAKFGVLGKILDKEISKRHISTGTDKDTIKKIFDNIEMIIKNDTDQNGRLINIEKAQGETLNRINNVEKSQFEYQMESYKKSIFDDRFLLIDRMSAGIKFLQNKGNSETKEYLLKVLAQKDLVMWNGLCKALDAMQYWQHKPEKRRRSKAS